MKSAGQLRQSLRHDRISTIAELFQLSAVKNMSTGVRLLEGFAAWQPALYLIAQSKMELGLLKAVASSMCTNRNRTRVGQPATFGFGDEDEISFANATERMQ